MGAYAGRSGRRYKRLALEVKHRETHCWRCGQPIDWSIPYRDPHAGTVNLNSGSVEHIQARANRRDLAEDPANLAASHLGCNMAAGNRDDDIVDLGTPSRTW